MSLANAIERDNDKVLGCMQSASILRSPRGQDNRKVATQTSFGLNGFCFFPRASERRVFQKEGGVNRST